MQPAGSPSTSAIRNPWGSAAWKHGASCKPGFHPSWAAQSIASWTSSRRMVRMVQPMHAILLHGSGSRIRYPLPHRSSATSGEARRFPEAPEGWRPCTVACVGACTVTSWVLVAMPLRWPPAWRASTSPCGHGDIPVAFTSRRSMVIRSVLHDRPAVDTWVQLTLRDQPGREIQIKRSLLRNARGTCSVHVQGREHLGLPDVAIEAGTLLPAVAATMRFDE